jgi:hypothetical protein
VTGSVHLRRLLADVRQSQVSSFLGTDGARILLAKGARATRFRLGDRGWSYDTQISKARESMVGFKIEIRRTRSGKQLVSCGDNRIGE